LPPSTVPATGQVVQLAVGLEADVVGARPGPHLLDHPPGMSWRNSEIFGVIGREAVMVSEVIQQDCNSCTESLWLEIKSSDYRADGDHCWPNRHGNKALPVVGTY
jgi:hypothetical protein